MAKQKRLSAATVHAIFTSKDSAAEVAARHKVSTNLVYLIQQRKIHKAITEGIRKPVRKRRSGVARRAQLATRIDMNRLADRMAEIVTRRVLAGLVDRLRGRR